MSQRDLEPGTSAPSVLLDGAEFDRAAGADVVDRPRPDGQSAGLDALLRERVHFDLLLAELSARFSHLREDEVDHEIEHWLGRLVAALDVDRSSFAEVSGELMVVTHSYAAPGLQPYPRGPANAALPWLTQELNAGRTVVLSQIPAGIPLDAVEDRSYFTSSGMKAGIGIPVLIFGAPICVLTFGAFRHSRIWSDDIIARLRLAGDVFGNAIARRAVKRQLEEKRLELLHLGRVVAMGELASVIAHELDQPLTVIVSNAEALRHALHSEQPDLADADESLREIADAAMRASEIVRRERQMLRKGPRAAETVDLNDVVREMELFIRADSRQFGAQVTLQLLPGLPAAFGDRLQLQQVVLNLAHNGLQAMRSQPAESRTLTICTQSGHDDVTLTVSDCGPAVDPLVMKRMFEPFYTTNPEGLGMGLAISKSIVERHHGRIWATANPTGGLTMHVCVPRK